MIHLRHTRIALLIGVLLLGLLNAAHAAQAIPAQVEHASIAEQSRFINEQAGLSLEAKLTAGRQRTEERQQFRQALVNSIQSTATRQRDQILAQLAPAPDRSEPVSGRPDKASLPLLPTALLCVLAGLLWRWRTCAEE